MTSPSQPSPATGGRTARRLVLAHLAQAGIPVALVGALLLSGCEKPAPKPLPPPVVEIMEVKNSNIPMISTIIGQLDSPQNVDVRARVEAFVEKIRFTEGENVKKGELLFELDKKPFEEKLAAAVAALAESTASQKKFEQDLARLEPLANSKAVSKQDLDNARSAVEASRASAESAKAKMESAQLDLGYCEVKAPIDGLIGAKEVSVGDLVGKGEPTLLATMSSLNPIWCYCNIAEVDFIKVKTRAMELGLDLGKLPLTLILPDGKDHPEKGRLVFFDRAVAVKTGTMRVRAEFPNPTEILRPGMFARVRFEGGDRQGIQVPERAIVDLQGKSFVWIVDANKKTHQRPVTLGDQNGSNITILDGLKPGENIILEGVLKAREGIQVNALTAGQAAAMRSIPADPKPAQP